MLEAAVEGGQPAVMVQGEAKEVGVGNLAMAKQRARETAPARARRAAILDGSPPILIEKAQGGFEADRLGSGLSRDDAEVIDALESRGLRLEAAAKDFVRGAGQTNAVGFGEDAKLFQQRIIYGQSCPQLMNDAKNGSC